MIEEIRNLKAEKKKDEKKRIQDEDEVLTKL